MHPTQRLHTAAASPDGNNRFLVTASAQTSHYIVIAHGTGCRMLPPPDA
jgi:hypothetical protein